MKHKRWYKALMNVCDRLDGKEIEWILVGSAGSVLQGADMEPNDLDLYVRSEKALKEIMNNFSALLPEKASEVDYDNPAWLSSLTETTFTQSFPFGFTWTKGKFFVAGFPVEVVLISESGGIPDNMTGDGIWEGGQYIWELSKEVRVDTHTIRTVPLEIQLESNLRRERDERAEAIIETLNKNGYDESLLTKALAQKHQAEIKRRISR
ncbi:nucleotidyltransferase domain-containing protein [Thalassobacillus hwangdonensis]|uniref:Nucleotidyltransferase domain-containing protein n=1 Tax=Thalassobacillus hwangdonensis TaxID=546108 RepID=A0ABW3KV16_9BACI